MRVELKRLHRELEATIVYVTHDQVEAMTMGDRIAVMKDGEILQTGTPNELYHRPANTFVAQFIGSVPTNLIPQTAVTNGNEKHAQRDLLVGFRAEHATIKNLPSDHDAKTNNLSQAKNNRDQPFQFSATVQAIDRLGDSTLVSLIIGSVNAAETNSKETENNIKTTEKKEATDLTTPKRKSPTNELPETGQHCEVTVRTSGDSDWRPSLASREEHRKRNGVLCDRVCAGNGCQTPFW